VEELEGEKGRVQPKLVGERILQNWTGKRKEAHRCSTLSINKKIKTGKHKNSWAKNKPQTTQKNTPPKTTHKNNSPQTFPINKQKTQKKQPQTKKTTQNKTTHPTQSRKQSNNHNTTSHTTHPDSFLLFSSRGDHVTYSPSRPAWGTGEGKLIKEHRSGGRHVRSPLNTRT